MSDNFIPLNQSTPVQNKWQKDKNQQQKYHNYRKHYGQRRGGYNKWGNNSRSSYGSNSSNSSYGQDRHNIDAYLHHSMLKDPWASLRQQNEMNSSSTPNT